MSIHTLPTMPAKDDRRPLARFLLFAGAGTPRGGWYDFRGAFASVDAARKAFVEGDAVWGHVLDCAGTFLIARWYKRSPYGTARDQALAEAEAE